MHGATLEMAGWSRWSAREPHKLEVVGSNPTPASMKFIKYTIIWISQNLAIPFWVVGHVHLSIHSFTFTELETFVSSVGLHIIVGIGFWIEYKEQNKNK